MPPPQANATITRVTTRGIPATGGPAAVDDWDQAVDVEDPDQADALPPGVKWEGTPIRAYYREATDRSTGEAVNVNLRRELIVTTGELDALDLDTDDIIEFTVDGHEPTTAEAEVIRRSELAGIPAALQTSKLTLAAA